MRFVVAWLLSTIALLSISGCRSGGTLVAPLAEKQLSLDIAIPTIATPGASPFISRQDQITISGLCKTGYVVRLSGDSSAEQLCENSAYAFSILEILDGLYTFQVSQLSPEGSWSLSASLVWLKKTSVSPPQITSPSHSPFASAKTNLTISGSCESGSTIQVSQGASANTLCTNSQFAFNIEKYIDADYTLLLTQTDGAGNSAEATLIWQKKELSASPANPTIVVANTQAFSLIGGSGDYTFSFVSNGSGGSFNSASKVYTAGTRSGVSDILRMTDSLGSSLDIPIAVTSGAADHFEIPSGSGHGVVQPIGSILTPNLQVKVVDRYGNGIPSQDVVFTAGTGDAKLLTKGRVTTNSFGIASIQAQLGFQALVNSFSVVPFSTILPDLAASGHAKINLSAGTVNTGNGVFGPYYPTGNTPESMALADLNSDGFTDLITVNTGDSSLSIYAGKSGGQYGTKSQVTSLCSGASGIVASDFSGDSKVDLVITCTGNDSVRFYRGLGDLSFAPPVAVSVAPDGNLPTSPVAGDLNRDGATDLAFAATGSGKVGVLIGNGDGTFHPLTSYAADSLPTHLTSADLNRDGNLDLIVTNSGNSNFGILLGSASGVFSGMQAYTTNSNPGQTLAHDFNGDSYPDIAVVENGNDTISIFPNDGTGAMDAPAPPISVGSGPNAIALSEVNGDSYPDLAVLSGIDNTVGILLGQSGGTFTSGSIIPTLTSPQKLLSLDLNTDGTKDFVVIGDNQIEVIPVRLGSHFGYSESVPASPVALATADFNSDGNLDQVIASGSGNQVSLLLGNGKGFFTTSTFSVTSNPTAVIAADLDGDHQMDFVVANQGTSNVKVYLGNGDGTFKTPTTYTTAPGPNSLVSVDLNSDGNLDLAIASVTTSKVSVLLGAGDGTFLANTSYSVGPAPQGIAFGDFNDDKTMDLVVSSNSDNKVSVLINNGSGTFQPFASYEVGGGPTSVATYDFNGDNKLDIISVNTIDGSITILRGDGASNFPTASRTDYNVGASPQGLVLGDFNGDSRTDIAVTNGVTQGLTILSGAATAGTFINSPVTVILPYSTTNLGGGDFNNDGKADLVLLNNIDNLVHTWLGH